MADISRHPVFELIFQAKKNNDRYYGHRRFIRDIKYVYLVHYLNEGLRRSED